MRDASHRDRGRARPAGTHRVSLARLLPGAIALLLGASAAVLVSCGSSTGKGLIPSANAEPLQSDFEAVSQAAAAGNGSCAATQAALGKTQTDYRSLPASIDAGLRTRLHEGIDALRVQALAQCAQPSSTATTSTARTTTASTATTSTQTTPTQTETTPTQTETTGTATTPATGPGGGTEAPREGGNGQGNGEGNGGGRSGGVGPGGD